MGGDQDLNLTIRAKDEATETIKKVEKTLGDVTKAQDNAGKSSESMATSVFKGVLAYDALKQGLNFAIGFLKESIQESMEASKVQAQLGAVLKSTGGAAGVSAEMALELAQALQKQTTYGDEAILSAENMLLTFTKIKSDVFPEAIKTVLDMSTALGQDTKNSAIQLGKALNDPITGVSALRKVGVTFNETQQETIKKLVESGKVMEAQKIILKELAVEFGGSSQAEANSFAGAIKQLSNELSDAKEEIGNELMPEVLSFVKILKDNKDTVLAFADVFIFLGKAAAYSVKGIIALHKIMQVNFSNKVAGATSYVAKMAGGLNYLGLVSDKTVSKIEGWSDNWSESADDIKDSIFDLYNEVPKLTDSLGDAGKGFNGLEDDAKSAGDSVEAAKKKLEKFQKIATGKMDIASEIIEQEKLIDEISQEMRDKSAERDKALNYETFDFEKGEQLKKELNDLQIQKNKEEDALARVKNSGLQIDPQIAEARRRFSLTDFERSIEDISSNNFGVRSIVPAGDQFPTGNTFTINFNSTVAGDEGVKKIIKDTINSLNRSTSLKTMGGA